MPVESGGPADPLPRRNDEKGKKPARMESRSIRRIRLYNRANQSSRRRLHSPREPFQADLLLWIDKDMVLDAPFPDPPLIVRFWKLTLIFWVVRWGVGGEDQGIWNGVRGLKTSATLFDGPESS